MKKTIWIDTFREIWHSKTRFLAILLIILLGVAFYVGISATGPDMIQTARNYYDQQNLMDAKVMSNYGLEAKDFEFLEFYGTEVQGHYTTDVMTLPDQTTLRFYSYDPDSEQTINQYVVTEGRLPEHTGEIALDNTHAIANQWNIGDRIQLNTEDESTAAKENLARDEFEVVGFVANPLYIEHTPRGSTSAGSGILHGYGVIHEDDFTMDVMTEAYLTFDFDEEQSGAYSESYEQLIENQIETVELALEDHGDQRYQQIVDDIETEIEKGEAEIQDAQEKISDIEAEIQAANSPLPNAENEYSEEMDMYDEQMPAEEEMVAVEAQIAEAEAQIAEVETQITEAEEDLSDARQQLNDLPEMTYIVSDRTINPGYAEYEDNAARIEAISGVFPVFFFLIAILISLTTMTRMVDEEREYIGIMKALGYKNHDILVKFLTYAFIATFIGAILGLFIGYRLFPELIFNAYTSLNLPPIVIQSYPKFTIIALVAAFISTVGATLYAVNSSLRSNAAALLRPKAPKKGRRILLEKISFIWNKLSFNYKITFRNVFRYKARMFMTIFGIAGSTALILTGFGLSDSISDIPYTQYTQINQFQAYVSLSQEADETEKTNYEQMLADNEQISGWLNVLQESVDVEASGVNPQTAIIVVPENTGALNDYILLMDPESNEPLALPDEGVIVTQKLAELFDLSVGDTFTGKTIDGKEWSFTIAGITKHYVAHFIYMTPEVYSQITGQEPNVTQSLVKYDIETVNEDKLGRWLMDQEPVIGIQYISEIYAAFMETINSLDLITQVLIISAALLTLIVLYNLTNINVAERIRELSTIKVLGFYNHEVTLYVYRENFILTTLGILIGYVVGWFLHQFLIRTTEVDRLLFSRYIDWTSYLYAAALVIIFSLIVMWIIHTRLKKINMVEALKGGD